MFPASIACSRLNCESSMNRGVTSRIASLKPDQQRRREERQKGREAADDQFAREARGGTAGERMKFLGLANQPPRFDQKLAPRAGQRDAYRLVANEEIEAEFLFEVVQRFATSPPATGKDAARRR